MMRSKLRILRSYLPQDDNGTQAENSEVSPLLVRVAVAVTTPAVSDVTVVDVNV